MSTNRTLNSQQISKNNLFKSSANNTINLNNKIVNNLTNSKENNNTFTTFSPKEINTINRNSDDKNIDIASINPVNFNFNAFRFSEDYITGFEIINKILSNLSDVFSDDLKIRSKFYYSNFFSKFLVFNKNIRRKSRTISNKSNKSCNSIVSDRYEKSNHNKSEVDSFIRKGDFSHQNDDKNSKFNYVSNENFLKLKNLKSENKTAKSFFNFNIQRLSNSLTKENNENLDDSRNEINTNLKNQNRLKSFLKYPSKLIKENLSDEDEEYNNEKTSEDEDFDILENENNFKKRHLNCSKESLYLVKIVVKNCSLFYKRNKINYIANLVNNLRENSRWNKILSVIHKNVLNKQYLTLDYYFSKLKKINNYNKGISKLAKIVYKYMRYLFDTFGHQTRVIYIVKKNLNGLTRILDQLTIRKKKFYLLKKLVEISTFKQKLPFYEIFITKLCKTFKRNNRRKTFLYLKKYYFALKIYTRNIQFLVSTIDSMILDVKRNFLNSFKIVNKINENLKSLILKKHLKRLVFIRKAFHKFIDNALNSDEGIYKRIKMKKVFSIYSYKLKFHSVKVNINLLFI